MAETGRGAFTALGKDNGRAYYEFVRNLPLDGSTPEKGEYYEAVHFGVKSIQQRLVDLDYDRFVRGTFVVDGVFDRRTRRMVKKYQEANGIYVSGSVGPTTAAHLFGTYVHEAAQAFKWDYSYLYGIMKQESAGDPGAQGWLTPGDRGIFQINTLVHDTTPEQAHDFVYATDWTCAFFQDAWKRYKGKGEELRVNCSIAKHNNPSAADQWFETGVAPYEGIQKYVSSVLSFAATAP